MRYGIDIDGVVADFYTSFDKIVNSLWPGRIPIDAVHVSWDYNEFGMDAAEKEKAWKAAEKVHNWWLTLTPHYDNLRAIALHRIRHPEDEIFFITARREVAGMPTMHQTQIWLSECGINGLGVNVIVDQSGNKSPIFNALECDANVDDKLEAVIEHSKRTRGAYLLSRPWNQDGRSDSIRVVSNLDEFFRKAGKSAASK